MHLDSEFSDVIKTSVTALFYPMMTHVTLIVVNMTIILAPYMRRHQMETFSALLAICAGNSPVIDALPAQRPVTRSFDGFFDLRLNSRLSKQWWGWWFATSSRPLSRHCNVMWSSHSNSFVDWIHVDTIYQTRPSDELHWLDINFNTLAPGRS